MRGFCLLFVLYCTLDDLAFYRDSNHLGEYYESPAEK